MIYLINDQIFLINMGARRNCLISIVIDRYIDRLIVLFDQGLYLLQVVSNAGHLSYTPRVYVFIY